MRVVSFGGHDVNDGENFRTWLTAPGQTPPEVEPQIVGRTGGAPTIGGVVVPARFLVLRTTLEVGTSNYTKRELQQLWYAWFVTDVTQALIIADDAGGNQRYVEAMPFSIVHAEDGDGLEIVTTLAVDGDVLWRSVTATTYAWEVTASGATLAVVNGDPAVNDDAYPVITVTPRQYASGINPYRRFAAVGWRAGQSATNYPVDVVAGGLDTRIGSTHFADAAGDDIRVYVDGVEADYWLYGANTAATKVWVNLAWQAGQAGALAGAMGSGSISSVTVNEGIENWPESGLMLIESEVFAYVGKSNSTKTFTGVTRAARGTTAATHAGGVGVVWVQHEIWIEYGDGGKAAAVVDGRYKPMFELASSSNGVWDYDAFFEDNGTYYTDSLRAGAWRRLTGGRAAESYGGNHGFDASPFVELGLKGDGITATKNGISKYWGLRNVCGISAANFQNGEFQHHRAAWWDAGVHYYSSAAGGEIELYSIPSGIDNTWNAWSQNVTGLPSGTTQIILRLMGYASSVYWSWLECSDVTLTLDSTYTPVTAVGGEGTTYRLQPVLANVTTGESVGIDAAVDVDEAVEIDVANHQVSLGDGSDAYNLVDTVEGVRRWILRLQAGENTLRYDEAGVVEVDVDVVFRRRWRV